MEEIIPSGLNVFGYLDGGFGLAKNPKYYLKAFDKENFPYCVRNVASQNSLSEDNPYPDSEKLIYPVNLYFINQDSIKGIKRKFHPSEYSRRYEIGVWLWELEDFPSFFYSSFEMVDELWVFTDYVYNCLHKISPVPVFKVPFPYEVPVVEKNYPLFEEFTFLFVFDFNSDFYRKNPLGVVSAFTSAFPAGEKVRLILKSSNGDKFPELNKLLLEFSKKDPRIECVDEPWPREKLNEVFMRSHAFISLHRSEGYGLNIIDALSLNKPCIVSAYGGNMEFMEADYPYLVPCRRIPAEAVLEFYRIPSFWGDPDLKVASLKMRAVADDYGEAVPKTALMKDRILSSLTSQRTVQWVRNRVEEIRASKAFSERIKTEKKVPLYFGLRRYSSELNQGPVLLFYSCRKERLTKIISDLKNKYPKMKADVFGREDKDLQSLAENYYLYLDSGFYSPDKVDMTWFKDRKYSLIIIPYFNYLGKGYDNIHEIARSISAEKRIGIGIEGDIFEIKS